MKSFVNLAALVLWVAVGSVGGAEAVKIFDGKTFEGWEGDTNGTWRIDEGAVVGGSLERTVPHNEFLRTQRKYTNFVLRLKFKLVGKEGFVNGGVQVRSKPVVKPAHELSGYQADMGEKWWGCLYDESRRNKVLVAPDPAAVERAIKREDWNDYEIRCEGKRIRTLINGIEMIDYTELDESIPQHGIIGLQIHGGGKAEASYKEVTVEELP